MFHNNNMEERHTKIIHINTQSVRNKLDHLMTESSEYDIIVLTETWLHLNIDSEYLKNPDFKATYRKDRKMMHMEE